MPYLMPVNNTFRSPLKVTNTFQINQMCDHLGNIKTKDYIWVMYCLFTHSIVSIAHIVSTDFEGSLSIFLLSDFRKAQ